MWKVIVIALALAGCARIQAATEVLTSSIPNPVTRQMLYDAENTSIILLVGLNTYKRTCVAEVIPQSCRGVIRQMQVYTRQMQPYIKSAREFVRNNDQVNAKVAYDTTIGLIANVRSVATANNVELEK